MLRDEVGQFVRVMSDVYKASMTSVESKVWGLLQGLKWTASLGYHRVVFENDCKMVVDDVHSNKLNRMKNCLTVRNCKTLFKIITTMMLCLL